MAKRKRERSILKGALAGLVGGIVGSGAKVAAERIYPGVPAGSEAPPDGLAGQLESAAKPWVVGAIAGAAYGAAIEVEPRTGVWGGAGFGLGLRKLTHQAFASPAGSGEVSIRQQTRSRQSEWVTYVVFGIVTEGVRRLVRRGL